MVARESKFVSTARTGTVDGGKEANTRIVGRILDPVPGFVRELTEIDFVGVCRLGQHPDVGTGAEYSFLVRRHDHSANLRVFEPDALQSIVELYINAQIV